MINKEFIVKDGAIYKDFINRSIPQYANNQVCVSVLIPASAFVGNDDYAVILAVAYRQTSTSASTTLNSLVLSASKSITLDGVLYVKYSAILSYDYTQNLGQLLFSPYIRKIIHEQGEYDSESDTYEDIALISEQQAYTYVCLNVIKSVLPQYDASLETGDVADAIIGMIEGKKIYTFIDVDSASLGEHYYNLVNDYNPNANQFAGCLVMSIYDNELCYYMPYINDGDVELLEITKDGVFYNISGVVYSNPTYTYVRKQISYSLEEVEAIKSNLQTQINGKVDKTTKVNGYALSGDITLTKGDVGLGNVVNYGVETTQPTASGDQLYITSKAVYDALQLVYIAISGCATDEDLTTINNRLDSIETIIGSDDGDADSVINTLKEVIVVLNGLGEGASLLDLINAKANQSDLTALDSQINGENGIATKVSFLYDSNANAYAEIKAQSGTIDILTTDWVANSDANYPYKWELSNGYLIGASYVSVVFDKDSDTSMVSATIGIDDENGKVILYASELPSATISIQLIAIFNSVNAYVLYNQTLINQVASNTSAISDINNTKLPQYLKQQYQYNKDGKLTAHLISTNQPNSSNISTLRVANDQTFEVDGGGNFVNQARLNLKTDTIQLFWRNGIDGDNFKNHELNIDSDGFELKYYEKTSGVANTHTLTFDANGDLKIDGNAVGGGGSQLYRHNIEVSKWDGGNSLYVYIETSIENDVSTSYDATSFNAYLVEKGYDYDHPINAWGTYITQGTTYYVTGLWVNNTGGISIRIWKSGTTPSMQSLSGASFGDLVK